MPFLTVVVIFLIAKCDCQPLLRSVRTLTPASGPQFYCLVKL